MSNYLHTLIGGFSNDKRREARKIFASIPAESAPPTTTSVREINIGIAVGILFEFKQIGIKKFTTQQAAQVVEIFGLKTHFEGHDILVELDGLFSGPKMRLYSTVENSNRIYDVPDDTRLQHLSQQFCPKEENYRHDSIH